MSGPVTNLPKAGVRLAPMPHGLVGVTSNHRPRLRVQLLAGAHEGPERVDNPAGHVQLNLIGGQVAEADWTAPLIGGRANPGTSPLPPRGRLKSSPLHRRWHLAARHSGNPNCARHRSPRAAR